MFHQPFYNWNLLCPLVLPFLEGPFKEAQMKGYTANSTQVFQVCSKGITFSLSNPVGHGPYEGHGFMDQKRFTAS